MKQLFQDKFLEFLHEDLEEKAKLDVIISGNLVSIKPQELEELHYRINREIDKLDDRLGMTKIAQDDWVSIHAIKDFAIKKVNNPRSKTKNSICLFLHFEAGWEEYKDHCRSRSRELKSSSTQSLILKTSKYQTLISKWDGLLEFEAKKDGMLWRVVYGGGPIPEDFVEKEKVFDFGFQIILFWESMIQGRSEIEEDVYDGWVVYRQEMYVLSPAVRAFVDRNKHYLSEELLDNFGISR